MFILKPVARSVEFGYGSGMPTYIMGGVPSASTAYNPGPIQRYNGVTRSTDSSTINSGAKSAAGGGLGDFVYVLGGQYGSNTNRSGLGNKYDGAVLTNFSTGVTGNWYDNASAFLANKIYILAGNYSGATNKIAQFDGSTTSDTGLTLTTSRSGGLSASPAGSNIFLFGGGSNVITRFTGSSSSNDAATLAASLTDVATTGSGSSGSLVFIFGGLVSPSTYQNTIQRYDGTTRSTDGATLSNAMAPGEQTGGQAANSMAGLSFIFGGRLSGSFTNVIQRYNGTTRTTDSATLSSAQVGHTCANVTTGFQ